MFSVRVPVGVDLVEYKKAGAFYRRHRLSLRDFFHPDELKSVRVHRRPHEALAVLLAAKEAAWKALGAPGFGPSFFKTLRVTRYHGALRCAAPGSRKPLELSVTKKSAFVVVHCAAPVARG